MDKSPPPNNSVSSSSKVEDDDCPAESSSTQQGQNNQSVADCQQNYMPPEMAEYYTQRHQAFVYEMTHKNLQPNLRQHRRPVPFQVTLRNRITNGIRPAHTSLSPAQIHMLESRFAGEKYVGIQKRMELSREFNVSEREIRTWFHYKRIKMYMETASAATYSSAHLPMPRQDTARTHSAGCSIIRRLRTHVPPFLRREKPTSKTNSNIYNNQPHFPNENIYIHPQPIASGINSVSQPNSASLHSSEDFLPDNWDRALSLREQDDQDYTGSNQVGQNNDNGNNNNNNEFLG